MSVTKLVWIALPNGIRADRQAARISGYLAPSLVSAAGTTVAQFPLFSNWPVTAAGLQFQVSFDGGDSWSAPLSAVYSSNNQLDPSLWSAIFGGSVSVGQHEPLTLKRNISSYDAGAVYSTLHQIYIPDPSELPPANVPNRVSRVASALLPATAAATPEGQAYSRFLEFHKPPARPRLQPSADAKASTNSDALDFHSATSALSRYPAAMRALGLVFDLELPLPDGVEAAGAIRVRPVSAALPPEWQIVFPQTAFALDVVNGRFTLRTGLNDPQHQLVSGMLFSQGSALIPIDLDAFGLSAASAAAGSPQPSTATPSPRNAGLSLHLPDLDTRLQSQINSGASIWAQIAANDNPAYHGDDLAPFAAEALIRGYRADVRTVEQNKWHSLCRRQVSFEFDATTRAWDPDEGLVGLGLTQEGSDAPRFSPMQVRWHGWSLCAPRPGKTIGVDGGADDQNQVAQALLPFKALTKPVLNSLPRLRFGAGHVQFRLRTVDLAGNSLSLDDPIDDALAMPQTVSDVDPVPGAKYLRVDPLPAPVLLLRDAPGPGESVERLVIVSDVDTPAPKNCERLVAMPKAAVQTAEWHGMLDGPAGVKGDPATRSIVVRNSSSFADAPYGANPPALPYLPDPLAGGASFFSFGTNVVGTPLLAPPQPLTDWPDFAPLRLQLNEAPVTSAPVWDPTSRTVTVGLAKGEVTSMILSSYPASLDPLEAWDVVLNAPVKGPGGPPPGGNGGGGKPFSTKTEWTVAQKTRFQQLTAGGQNSVISPRRALTLVHAVARPLIAPVLNMQAQRDQGSTLTGFEGAAIPFDGKSTAKVELLAEWDEPVDDGVNPPGRVSRKQHVAELQPDIQGSFWDLHFPLIQHRLGDTKYRRITYHAISTTRFLEYLDPAIRPIPEKTTQTSNRLTIDVPSSAQPLPPKLLYAVPFFQHETRNRSVRRTGGVRIYLDRPWYSSGDGELLAVLLATGSATDAALAPETMSTWGQDPLYASGATPTPQFLTPANFSGAAFQQTLPISISNNRFPGRTVLGFNVSFLPPDPTEPARAANPDRDPHNGRWFVDLHIDAGQSYSPMLRLALARVQPNSVEPVVLVSPVVIANLVPLAPERLATVVPDPTNAASVAVTVAGPTYTSGTAPRTAVTPQIQPDPGGVWVSLPDVELQPQTNSVEGVQSGTVALPAAIGSSPMRLLLRESELLPNDGGIGARLTYAEVINL